MNDNFIEWLNHLPEDYRVIVILGLTTLLDLESPSKGEYKDLYDKLAGFLNKQE